MVDPASALACFETNRGQKWAQLRARGVDTVDRAYPCTSSAAQGTKLHILPRHYLPPHRHQHSSSSAQVNTDQNKELMSKACTVVHGDHNLFAILQVLFRDFNMFYLLAYPDCICRHGHLDIHLGAALGGMVW